MLAHLADVSIRSLLLALPAWAILWLLRRRTTAALQHAVWTAVVCGMLALFAFSQALPRLPLRILTSPVAPARVSEPLIPSTLFEPAPEPSPLPAPIPATERRSIDWSAVAVYGYGAIAFAFLAQYLTGMFLVRRLIASASPAPCGGENAVYESEFITVPATVGWLHPRILLPPEWHEWDREKLDAVLAHEGAHVRRRDTLTALFARVNRCIFWFHPLAWMLERRLALLAEQACDESSVAALGDRTRYAHLLLEMASVVDGSHGRLQYHALTMASRTHIPRRIESLLQEGRTFSRGLAWTGWAAVMLCGIPVVCGAGAVDLEREPALLQLEMPKWATPKLPSAEVLFAQSRPSPPEPVSAPPAAQAQKPAPAPAKFEVASIKPAPGCVQPRPGAFPRGRLTIPCLTVQNMIQVSYGTYGPIRNPGIRIMGGPAWYASDRFDLTAKAEDPNTSVEEMFGPMLRALLEDRFGLKAHREDRDLPVYVLTVARNGPKIQPLKEGGCTVLDYGHPPAPRAPGSPVIHYCGTSASVRKGPTQTIDTWGASVADFLHASISRFLDRPVIDKTGLAGLYDFHLQFAPEDNQASPCSDNCASPADLAAPSLYTAFEDQLGLKLSAEMGPVEVLVIDHIDGPSEN
jgi:uncharacterized protein (TIGR03435 family)